MGAIIDFIHKLSGYLPEIRAPTKLPSIKERFLWTGIALLLFFVMYNVTVFGASHSAGAFDFLQMITASKIGSLLTTSIGPIVLASIFLQLFSGAGLIDLDPKNPEQRQKFQEVQKVLALIIALVEASIFVFTGRIPLVQNSPFDPTLLAALVIFQVSLGSAIVLYLDEIVTKYGIGSGISLFIAAGVSFSIIGGAISLFVGEGGVASVVAGGGAEAIPNALLVLLPLLVTLAVFAAVCYGEGVKVEIPLAYQQARGVAPKLPLNLFYLSNIPVIFASALLLNLQLFSAGLEGKSFMLGDFDLVPAIGYVDSTGQLRDGLLYFFTPVFGGNTLSQINFLMNGVTPLFGIPEWLHAIIYVIFLALVSVLFGMFWAETANMDTKGMTNQLMQSGMQVPGWRRDPRMMEKVLEKYIPPLIILGSFLVGLLAGLADLTGALGTGTGILLTVGIFYRTYLQMKRQRMLEAMPIFETIAGE
ncbi:MAG: preprotein translocase subunit SecY [Candidatus Micrarchaeota archaeon]